MIEYILGGIGCIIGAIFLMMGYICDFDWWETIKHTSTAIVLLSLLIAGAFLLHTGMGG